MTNGYFVYDSFSQLDGEYQFKANTTTSSIDAVTIDNIFRDSVAPNDPTNLEPSSGAYTNDPTPQISYDATDGLSGVKNVSARLEDSDNNLIEDENDTGSELLFTVANDNSLSDAEYDVEYTIYDEAGKQRTGSWSFTVDTTMNIDSTPEVSGWNNIDDQNGNVISMDDGDADVVVEFDKDNNEEPDTVTCFDGDPTDDGDQVDSADQLDDQNGYYRFECTFDEDWTDQEVDLWVRFQDVATNQDEKQLGDYVLDNSDPVVDSVDLASEATAYNSPFDVSVDVDDDVSGIEEVEYFFDASVSAGNGELLDYDGDTYEVDPSDLESGEQTVYMRAKDGAQKWSSFESADFEYYPNKTPELSISVPESMEVTKGEIGSFDVTVENTGDLFIANSTITASTDSYSEDETVEDLSPGDSEEISFDYDSSSKSLGEKTISVASNYGQSGKFTLIVRANSEQESEIESDVEKYKERFEELKQNSTEIESKLSDDRKQRLNSNMSEFESALQEAQNAVESGDYYKAKSVLEDIDSDYQGAKTSYETVWSEQQQANKKQTFIMVGTLALLLLAGAGGFFWYSDDYDLNVERLTDSDIDIGSFDDLTARVRTIFKNESEAEEFEWDGFSND